MDFTNHPFYSVKKWQYHFKNLPDISQEQLKLYGPALTGRMNLMISGATFQCLTSCNPVIMRQLGGEVASDWIGCLLQSPECHALCTHDTCQCSASCVHLWGWQYTCYVLQCSVCLMGKYDQSHSWLNLGPQTGHNSTFVELLDSASSSN